MPSPLRGTPYAPLARRQGVVARGSAHINLSRPQRLASAFVGGAVAGFATDRQPLLAAPLLALGGYLALRGYSGHCPVSEALGIDTSERGANDFAVVIETSVTVARPREEVYQMWRRLENLPRFMQHLDTVTVLGGGQSRWSARAPGGLGHVEWLAETVADEPGRELAWRSLPGADVDNAGRVRFADAPAGRGTEVRVRIEYRPPAGRAGAAAASWLDPVLEQLVREDVRRFKQVAEAGEVPTVEGQPSGRA
jgi:uncharacterized membrane protein